MRELLEFLAAITAAGVVVFGAIFGIGYLGTQWECGNYGRMTGLQTRTQSLTCYIKGSDRWYAWEEWKLRGATKGQ